MDLSMDGLLASLTIGAVGMGLFMYGKRQERYPQMLGGAALMIYPYFVSGEQLTWVLGGLICAGIVAAVQMGY